MTYEGSFIDPTEPSIARVYNYLLGGKDTYAVDRETGDVFKRDLPGSVAIAFAHRATLVRAVGEIAKTTGIRQFIDMGSGLPTADNVHQVRLVRRAAGGGGRAGVSSVETVLSSRSPLASRTAMVPGDDLGSSPVV